MSARLPGRQAAVRRAGIGFSLLAAALLFSILAASALTFPPLTGRVVDEAGILDPAARASLEQKLADFEAKTTGQLVVVTLKSLQGTSIDDYGYQLGRAWGIGQKGKNSGALLIVAPNERKVRIEVGYGLEGDLTDAISKLIIENSILPRFRANDFSGGIARGVDDIVQVLTTGGDDWRERAKVRPDSQPAVLDFIVPLLLFLVIVMILRNLGRHGGPPGAVRRGPGGTRRQGPIIVPMPVPWDGRSGSSDWSGNSGGFSGGGGSFGGGGASGSW